MSAPEDSRIVGDVLDGDVNAYALLVNKYQKPIYKLYLDKIYMLNKNN